MNKRATYVLVDAQGESVVRVVTTNGGIGAIETAIQAHSNGAIVTCAEGNLEIYSSSPVTGTYSTVRVVARISFLSTTGSLGSVFIDSPNSDIFLSSDPDQVDPTAISDLVSACIGNLICGDGTVASTYQGGQIMRTKLSAIATLSNY